MNTPRATKKRLAEAALVSAAYLAGCGPASAASVPDSSAITVTRAADVGSSLEWNVTLPKRMTGRIQDQVWLVVDGHSEGMAGGDVPPADFPGAGRGPLRVRVGISSDLDEQMKDVFKAQGMPVKADVTVYRISYGIDAPDQCRVPKTLRFRHSASGLLRDYGRLPAKARYKIGDRITLMDAVALDSATLSPDSFELRNDRDRLKPGVSTDLAHHIVIQVQFLRVGADGKLITKAASK